MISRFFNQTFYVYRQVWLNNLSGEALISSFQGHLQQLTAEEVVNYANAVTVTHRIWVALAANVIVGDTLKCGADNYSVRAIQKNETGRNPHLEMLIEKDTDLEMSA